MHLSSGTRLGPYEIIAPVGTGGMGEVYRAKDTRLNRTVAIKVLPAHLAGNPELRQRLEREAKTVSSLNHPHICTLHDIGHQDGMDYLVMEYLEGDTLAARLAKGPLPLRQALPLAIEIADALEAAHRRSVVHRDLKPANIMLTKSGAKLLDFGLARIDKRVPLDGNAVLRAQSVNAGRPVVTGEWGAASLPIVPTASEARLAISRPTVGWARPCGRRHQESCLRPVCRRVWRPQ